MYKSANIAAKYATAFFNVFEKNIDEKLTSEIQHSYLLLSANPNILYFFSFPNLRFEERNRISDLLLKKLNLPDFFKKLTDLLIKDNRMYLLKDILHDIVSIYFEKNKIASFEVSSVVELKNNDKETIENFLVKKLNKEIILNFKIDKKLIAGIKIKSNNLLWEYSVARQLDELKKQILLGI